MIREKPDITNSEHNAFVQDWLTQYFKHTARDGAMDKDYEAFETVIEAVQETYDYKDHEARRKG
jgi:hypothetical protein